MESERIKEFYDPKTKKFEFRLSRVIDSDTFREICRDEFLVDVFTVNHVDGQTVGYSKRI